MQGEVTSKAEIGKLEVWVQFPQLTTVRDFAVEDWMIAGGSELVHARLRLGHGPMKRGHYVYFGIAEDSIPGNLQELTCDFLFSLDQHRMRVTGNFRKDGQGRWAGIEESLKLERL